MENEKLRLEVVSIEHPEIDKLIKERHMREIDELVSNGMYFHGQLEQDSGHDQFVILNLEDLSSFLRDGDVVVHSFIDYEGEIDVEVYGNDKKCAGYIWKPLSRSNIHKGLIFYADDETAKEYALKCYNKKKLII